MSWFKSLTKLILKLIRLERLRESLSQRPSKFQFFSGGQTGVCTELLNCSILGPQHAYVSGWPDPLRAGSKFATMLRAAPRGRRMVSPALPPGRFGPPA